MELTKEQVEFLVEYFYEHEPDYDGYLGSFSVEEKVMERFREKYPDEWDVKRSSPWKALLGFAIVLISILAFALGLTWLMQCLRGVC